MSTTTREAIDTLPLPDLPEPLPPAPAVVRKEIEVLEVWELVNELYSALQDVKPEEKQKRKKIMRAIAPPLLLGLKFISQCATNGILEHEPDAKNPTTKLTDHNVKAWLNVWSAAEVRFRRWTKDTSQEKMRADDPNNNHTIRDLTWAYRERTKHWWVALADADTEFLRASLMRSLALPTGHLSIQFLKRRSTTQGNCEYVISVLTMLERYAGLVPAARAVSRRNWVNDIKAIERELETFKGLDIQTEFV